MFFKIGVKKFAVLTGKHLRWSAFLILTIKTPERRHRRLSGVFIVKFERPATL